MNEFDKRYEFAKKKVRQQQEAEEHRKEFSRSIMEPEKHAKIPPLDTLESRRRRTRQLVEAIAERRCEALRLYTPLDVARKFHESKCQERIVIGSNRAGKTLTAAVEVAMAVTGIRPTWLKKNAGASRYPKENGRAVAVGKDLEHIGQVMWRKLSRAGAYQIIFDDRVKSWRPVLPDQPYDKSRPDQWKPAPPLIPPRLIKRDGIAWEDARRRIPKFVALENGWEITFRSSNGQPPQGFDADLIWFDEEIIDPEWYPEVAVRGIVDRKGRFFWSATPQAATERLFVLHKRAQDPSEKKVEEYFLHIESNYYLSKEAKEDFRAKLNPDELAVRWEGKFAMESLRVYPEFSEEIHGAEMPAGGLPHTWTYYLAVDPGVQVAAAVLVGIPPGNDRFIVCGEVYRKRANPDLVAHGVAQKWKSLEFQAFYIDAHAGKQTQIGTGRTIESYYSEAFKKYGLSSVETGSGFHWGTDNVEGRTEAVRKLLHIRPDGRPTLSYLKEKCPFLVWEFGEQFYKRERNGTITNKRQGNKSHAIDCLEYLAGGEPVWRPKKTKGIGLSQVMRWFEEKKKRLAKEQMAWDEAGIRLGPGGV